MSKSIQYAVKCVADHRYYNENGDIDDEGSLDSAMLWKTRRGAQNTADDWGSGLVVPMINEVVEVEVVIKETRKVV